MSLAKLDGWNPTLPQVRPASLVGYTFGQPLGKGKYSRVFQATSAHHNLRGDVALKFVVPTSGKSPDELKLDLDREVAVCRGLKSERFCVPYTLLSLRDFDEWPPYCLVMPHYDWSLRDFFHVYSAGLLRPSDMPLELILRWLMELTQGLEELHRNRSRSVHSADRTSVQLDHEPGIVHRDIKPENILIRLRSAPSQNLVDIVNFFDADIAICDFGICSQIGSQPIVLGEQDDPYKEEGSLQAALSNHGRAAQPGDDIFALGKIIGEFADCTVAGREELRQLGSVCMSRKPTAGEVHIRLTEMADRATSSSSYNIRHIREIAATREVSRRVFLTQVLGTSVAAMSWSFASQGRRFFTPDPMPVLSESRQFPLNSVFVERYLSTRHFGLDAGNTNELRKFEGKTGVSKYVKACWLEFNDIIKRYHSLKPEILGASKPFVNHNLETDANILFVAGPVASAHTRFHFEYDQLKLEVDDGKTVLLPVAKKDSVLPLHYYCGTSGFGKWTDGKQWYARRYEDGDEVWHGHNENRKAGRPLYSIQRNGQILFGPDELLNRDDGGFLRYDFLLITVRPHPIHPGKRISNISGMHGHSVLAFATSIHESLQKLDDYTKKYECFQLLVPADLLHDHARKTTTAVLRWEQGQIEKDDLLVVPDRLEDWIMPLDSEVTP
jgi:serine/threonine protein kinase